MEISQIEIIYEYYRHYITDVKVYFKDRLTLITVYLSVIRVERSVVLKKACVLM